MYFSKSSFSCFRFILCGTTAIDALEALEELDEERDLRRKIWVYWLIRELDLTRDLGFVMDGRLLTLFSSSDEEEEELRDLLPLLVVVVTKAWLVEWLVEEMVEWLAEEMVVTPTWLVEWLVEEEIGGG